MLVEREAIGENLLLLLLLIPFIPYRYPNRIQSRFLISKIPQHNLPLPNTQQLPDKLFKAVSTLHQQVSSLFDCDTHLFNDVGVIAILNNNH